MSKLRGLVVLGAVLALTGLVQGAASASADVRTGEVAVVSADEGPRVDPVAKTTAVNPLSGDITIQAAGCGSTCNGKSPTTYNVCTRLYGAAACASGEVIVCNSDARTIGTAYIGSGWAQLRYSPLCRTAWTTSYHPNATSYASWIEGGGGATQYRPSTSGTGSSMMINDAGYTARAAINCTGCGGPSYTVWY